MGETKRITSDFISGIGTGLSFIGVLFLILNSVVIGAIVSLVIGLFFIIMALFVEN
jgi:hypothetical protein